MKFNVDIEIDWVNEDDSIDEKIIRQIVSKVSSQIEEKFIDHAKSNIARSADKLITAKTEQLIYSVLEKPVVISDGWNSKKEYESIYDMVEQRMTNLYEGKLGSNGKCEKDPLLVSIEKYVDTHMSNMLRNIQNTIERQSKISAQEVLKESSLIKALKEIVPDVNEAINK